MEYAAALLEDWMREHYFETSADIGSSGVADYSLREVREIVGISIEELDAVVFNDSPCTGEHGLRKAIAERWGTDDAEWVITTHGASEAIYSALLTVLDPGDHVIALDPTYHTHTSVPESLNCVITSWPLRAERGFAPDLAELAALVDQAEDTAAIIVNFPHNPTGVTLTEGELNELVRIARDADAYLVWDAAFSELTYGSPPLRDPILSYQKTISVGTFSKAFGLPGMRFGWCLANPDVIRRMVPLRDRMILSISPLIEYIATRVIRQADALIGPRLEQAAKNRELLSEWARRHADHVELTPAAGSVTTFPRLRHHADTRELCLRLSERHGVLLVPGAAFGHPDRVRLGFGGPTAEFIRALSSLSQELTG